MGNAILLYVLVVSDFLLNVFLLQVRLRAGGDCEECSMMVHVSGGVYHVLKAGEQGQRGAG